MKRRLPDHLYIATHSYYDRSGSILTIGGVQTYLQALCQLGLKYGIPITILQKASKYGERIDPHGNQIIFWKKRRDIAQILKPLFHPEHDLIIYSDMPTTPTRLLHPCIFLQHGIFWDSSPSVLCMPELQRFRERWDHHNRCRRIQSITRLADRVVCVDTNFPNWYHATFVTEHWWEKIDYVPNFADLARFPHPRQRPLHPGQLRCIFPRRFVPARGSLVFAEIAARVAREYPHVTFVFIGDGKCQLEMERITSGIPRIEYYRRSVEEMPAEYEQADITVIPTLASEGTSLSCLEAMAAGCAVIGTTVGGLCNIIQPDYNGIICAPTMPAIEHAVRQLINDPAAIARYGQRGRDIVEQSYSAEKWETRILQVMASTLAR